jgi:SAM-dependent methyltransferase
MSGFSPDWLALREPADHASINAEVRRHLLARFAGRREPLRVVDLGAGAGSNLRGLAPALAERVGGGQSWTLVDYDTKLLAVARARTTERPIAGVDVALQQADFSGGDFARLIVGADLVTAAALFDLISVTVIDKLAAAVAANRQVFATVLTYDGIASWLPAGPLDEAMRQAFNAHQHGDKGFGPAAGPDATEALAKAFARHGYRIVRGKSPWVLDQTFAPLRDELDRGFAGAVAETGRVARADTDRWLAARAKAAADAVTIIGHEDILAVPA